VKFRLEHIGLAARDPIALKEWYTAALDAEVVLQCDSPGKPPTFFVRLPGESILEIYPAAHRRDETADNALAGWRHLALQVDSIEETRDDLIGRGVIFDQPIKPAGGAGCILFFHDPEGNLLHLVERPSGSFLAIKP
jgi:glyoxylase I family protein